MATNPGLIKGLKKIQVRNKLTDGQMAKMLGCNRELYRSTKLGNISIGLTILKGACKAFPELTGDAIFFLTDGAYKVTDLPNLGTAYPQARQDAMLWRFRRWLNRLVSRMLGLGISDRG